MKRMKLFCAVAGFVLIPSIFSCSGRKSVENSEEETVNSETSFKQVATEFLYAFDKKEANSIGNFIDEKIGFFVLDNPGAVTIPYFFTSWEQIASMEGEFDIAYLNKMRTNFTELIEGKHPEFSCETNSWSQQGCIVGTQDKLGLEKVYNDLLGFGFIEQEKFDSEIENAKKFDRFEIQFVYCTSANVGFYFTFKDDKWILVCIDKVAPCSA